MSDVVVRRILGAVRFLDRSTESLITIPMQLDGNNLQFIRNRLYCYVIKSVSTLSEHTKQFEQPPEEPPFGSLSYLLTVTDPKNKYLPQQFTIRLPKDHDQEQNNNANSLFRPIDIKLFPSPCAPLNLNWSTIRVTIVYTADGFTGEKPAAGALLLVRRVSDNAIIARGLSDKRGEALVIIPGIPITNFSEEDNGETSDETDSDEDTTDPVVVYETSAQLEIIFDPDGTWPVNPRTLEQNRSEFLRGTDPVTLKTGRTETRSIVMNL